MDADLVDGEAKITLDDPCCTNEETCAAYAASKGIVLGRRKRNA